MNEAFVVQRPVSVLFHLVFCAGNLSKVSPVSLAATSKGPTLVCEQRCLKMAGFFHMFNAAAGLMGLQTGDFGDSGSKSLGWAKQMNCNYYKKRI